jgi:Bifunctional DNA primase/polymerase, N-terminal/YspA, cpYpsA-related SLOG family
VQHDCLRVPAGDPDAQRTGIGAAALRYARLGYAVLPLARGGKAPHRMLGPQGGVWHATGDERWIRYWWAQDPAAGIGIACGQASGLIVIDIDTKHGLDGAAQWGALIRSGMVVPAAEHRRTGPGRRVMVTGSRTWDDGQAIVTGLSEQWGEGDAVLVTGGCPRGADRIAAQIWESWGGRAEQYPADWSAGRGAGFARNTQLARSGVDVCLAFIRWGSAGATHAAGEAQAAGVPVRWHTSPLPLPAEQLAAMTPSGGQHLYFRPSPGLPVPNRNGLLPGVDIKGDGGYVAAWPSRVMVESIDPAHGDGSVLVPYVWRGCPCSVPGAPAWLLDWAVATPAAAGHPGGQHSAQAPDLESLVHTGIPSGQRNAVLHRLACRLYGQFGTTPGGCAAVEAWISQVLARTDRNGFGDHEVRVALASAQRYVDAQREAETRRAAMPYPHEPWS